MYACPMHCPSWSMTLPFVVRWIRHSCRCSEVKQVRSQAQIRQQPIAVHSGRYLRQWWLWAAVVAMKRKPPGSVLTSGCPSLGLGRITSCFSPLRALSIHIPPIPIPITLRMLHPSTIVQSPSALLLPPPISFPGTRSLPRASLLICLGAHRSCAKPQTDRTRDD